MKTGGVNLEARNPETEGTIRFSLPAFANTQEAIRFGQTITLHQYLFLLGARTALQEEFNEIRSVAGTQQVQADLACKMQLLRECLNEAPLIVLSALIDSTIAGFIQRRPVNPAPTLTPARSEEGVSESERRCKGGDRSRRSPMTRIHSIPVHPSDCMVCGETTLCSAYDHDLRGEICVECEQIVRNAGDALTDAHLEVPTDSILEGDAS